MTLNKEINNLILYDRKNIFKRIDFLKKKLDLEKKMDEMVTFIDDIDSIYISNLDLEKNDKTIKEQITRNSEKILELRCMIKGKRKFIKHFGKIGSIPYEKLQHIFELLMLIKLSKKISETSYFASQYYRSDKQFEGRL